ncbi:hypothetical protein [Actinoplanes siamensis]|uniref:Uncharacterized protein n=1 Tax=Actinoplanes siamensis TaxID=1223317 RepID=A0A919N776_9ACTN|nr:hypothetical protein [Actinoplanes siamensis]GIF05596.1 hypothetical protein Asi03nite_31340 [Actinoplanes siamensis]
MVVTTRNSAPGDPSDEQPCEPPAGERPADATAGSPEKSAEPEPAATENTIRTAEGEPAAFPKDRIERVRRGKDLIEALVAVVLLASAAYSALGKVRTTAGWSGITAVTGGTLILSGGLLWLLTRRAGPGRRRLSLSLIALGLVAVGVSYRAARPHGRPSALPLPSAAAPPASTEATTPPPTAAATTAVRSRHAPDRDRDRTGRVTAGPPPPPPRTPRPADPVTGAAAGTPVPDPPDPAPTTTAPTSSPTPEVEAAIRITGPAENGYLDALGVDGVAGLPPGHRIWLLWQHGADDRYEVAGPCAPATSFHCDQVALPADGVPDFRLTVIVVDPATDARLHPGLCLTALPPHAAEHSIAILRPAY